MASSIDPSLPAETSGANAGKVLISRLRTQLSNAANDINSLIVGKQDALVSGTTLKTINGTSLLGSGNITITGGSGSATNLTTTAAPTTVTINSDTGTDAAIAAADSTNAGLLLPAEKTKLAGLPSDVNAAADARITAQKGAASGLVPLGSDSKIASTYLPSYVDDVLEAANFASLPGVGETAKIYITLNDNKTFRWSGSAYVAIVASPGTTDAVTEGTTNLYFTATRVQTTVLTGLNLATNAAITATDTVLSAFGKVQKQVTDALAVIAGKQDTLVSGTSVKTVNGSSILGSGDLTISTSGYSQVAFNPAIDLSSNKVMASNTVTGPIAFTSTGTPVGGNRVLVRLIANGTNAPTYPATFKESTSSKGYTNTNGVINNIVFTYNGSEVSYTIDSTGTADITAPTLTSAIIANGAPTVVALTFSEGLDTTATLQTADFTVSGKTITGVAFGSTGVINITVGVAFAAGNTATVAYNKSATVANNIKDTAGNLTATIAATAITNNIAGAPTTSNFTEANITAGFMGYFNSTSNSGQRRFASKAVWAGYITGSQATVLCGPNGTPFWVSVDNAEETQPTVASGSMTLFTGLSDTVHFVQIRVDGAYNDNGYFTRGGTMMTVTGVAPAVADIATYEGGGTAWNIHDTSFPGQHTFSKSGQTSLQIYGSNMLPNHNMSTRAGTFNQAGAIRIRAKGNAIWILTYERLFSLFVDGVLTKYDISGTDLNTAKHPSYDRIAVWRKITTGLSTSTYKNYIIVPSSDDVAGQPVLAVMVTGSGAAFTTLSQAKTVTQYGDSITASFNAGGALGHDLDTYNWGAQLGILAATKGHAGIGSLQLIKELSTATSANQQVSEYAVLAIGTNDGSSASTAQGSSTTTATVTNASVIPVTNASSFAVGQYIDSGALLGLASTAGIPYGTYISSISGNNLTIANGSGNQVTISTSGVTITGNSLYVNIKAIVASLLSYGHTKIAVRACSTQYQTAKEQNIVDAVISIANANVKYFGGSQPTAGTNSWNIIATGDGLHPTASGYVQYANYEATDYATFFTP